MTNDLLSPAHSPNQSPARECSTRPGWPRTPQAALAALGHRVLKGVALSTLMDEAVTLIAETLNVDYVHIFERLPGRRELRLRAGTGWQDGALGRARVGSGEEDSMAVDALLSEETLVIEDFRTETRFYPCRFLSDYGITSGMTAVIDGRDEPFGVLGVFTRHRRTFSQDEVHFVQAFANVLAMAVIDKRSEEEHNQLRSREQTARGAAMEAQWRLAFLTGVSNVLDTATDYDSTIEIVTRLAVPFLADWCAIDVIEGESVRRAAVRHSDPTKAGLARELQQRYPPILGPEYVVPKGVTKVLRTGRSCIVPEVTDSVAMAIAHDAEHLRILRGLGLTSAMCVPLICSGRTIGALTLVAAAPDRRFGPTDLVAAEEFARRVASAIDNARLLRELAERERRLQSLTEKLLDAQEEERRRIAYDVHDGLAQVAASAHQHLQAFARHHLPSSPQAREMLDRALELTRRTVKEARRVIADLRPTTLDAFGLPTAIRLHVEELRAEGWQIEYEEGFGCEHLPAAMGIALFRVVQEALTNVRKHAQTLHVRIVLRRLGQTVRLEVQDWGRGFVPSAATSGAGAGERLGLISMRERVTLLNGRFTIESQLNAGTRVVAEIPLLAFPEGVPAHEETNITNAAV